MLVAPPIGTTKMPFACRSRPARSAKVCTAAWSLIPSTSTTAHEPGSLRARAAAASATSAMSSSLAAMRCGRTGLIQSSVAELGADDGGEYLEAGDAVGADRGGVLRPHHQ